MNLCDPQMPLLSVNETRQARAGGQENIVPLMAKKRRMVFFGLANGLMHAMFYAGEVREDEEFKADAGLVADKELGLAVKLIEALAAKFEPAKFKDKYREQVEALIAAKIQGGEVAAGKAQPALAAPVVDIMEALKKSLAATRTPVARAEEVSGEAKVERRAPKRQAKKH